jgi:alpha-tubulin suppressor-like RCC1 family protein
MYMHSKFTGGDAKGSPPSSSTSVTDAYLADAHPPPPSPVLFGKKMRVLSINSIIKTQISKAFQQQQKQNSSKYLRQSVRSVSTANNTYTPSDFATSVYVWGRSDSNQLMLRQGPTESNVSCKKVSKLESHEVISVASSLYHSLAVGIDGRVIASGSNDEGQLGTYISW